MIGDHITGGEPWHSEPERFGTDTRSYRSEYQERARERDRRRAEQRRRRRKAVVLGLSVVLWIVLIRWPSETTRAIAGAAVVFAACWVAYQLVRFAIEEHRRQ